LLLMGKQLMLKEKKVLGHLNPKLPLSSLLSSTAGSGVSNWRATLPSPILPLSLSSPPLEVGPFNTARRSGEHCLPQLGLGRNNSGNRIGCFSHGGTNFTNFPDNQLTTVYGFFYLRGMHWTMKWLDGHPHFKHSKQLLLSSIKLIYVFRVGSHLA